MAFPKEWPLILGLGISLLVPLVKRVIGKRTGPALMDAVNRGDVDAVKKLLSRGALVNFEDEHLGRTPLITAAMNGRAEIVEILLGRGADPNAADMEGWTSLRYANAYGYEDVAEMLRAAGAQE